MKIFSVFSKFADLIAALSGHRAQALPCPQLPARIWIEGMERSPHADGRTLVAEAAIHCGRHGSSSLTQTLAAHLTTEKNKRLRDLFVLCRGDYALPALPENPADIGFSLMATTLVELAIPAHAAFPQARAVQSSDREMVAEELAKALAKSGRLSPTHLGLALGCIFCAEAELAPQRLRAAMDSMPPWACRLAEESLSIAESVELGRAAPLVAAAKASSRARL